MGASSFRELVQFAPKKRQKSKNRLLKYLHDLLNSNWRVSVDPARDRGRKCPPRNPKAGLHGPPSTVAAILQGRSISAVLSCIPQCGRWV
jgi:hypothetical protein